MEPLQSKPPRMLSRWTIVRGIKYAAGLIILILATLACVVWFDLAPAQFDKNSGIYVGREKYSFGASDAFDIVEYDRPSREIEISVGDYVVMFSHDGVLHAAEVYAGPIGEPCTETSLNELLQPDDNFYCDTNLSVFRYSAMVPGGLEPQIKRYADKDVWFDKAVAPWGVRPKIVGNLHEYFIINDEITDAFGGVLFNIYKWTGLNLFGLSK